MFCMCNKTQGHEHNTFYYIRPLTITEEYSGKSTDGQKKNKKKQHTYS